jgi:large subunit ribosomal protein L6
MSRVGKEPLPIPDGVAVTIDDQFIKVNGKLGELDLKVADGIGVSQDEGILRVSRSSEIHQQRALHGLTRALLANMVHGVSQGFKKDLEIVGVGYRCEMRGLALQLAVGFSHRVVVFPPEGVEFTVTSQTAFSVAGIDNQLVGDTAAKIRAIRPPEPYKGKGIKYAGEHIRRKAGKAAGK